MARPNHSSARRTIQATPPRADAVVFPDGAVLARLRRNLIRWFATHGRDLPWRRSRDAYAIWVSEIMLQQTTVAAVIPYFERFIARFPTVHALARAREHDVLRLWEGLGYYSRARNLRLAAKQLVAQTGGRIPQELSELLELPGIGRYTAGAIASLAYDRPAPIVEANTLRVYARLLAYEGDVHSTTGRNAIWTFAERAVPRRSAGIFNQALMDLGATVCTPAEPCCGECPLRSCCRAFRDGLTGSIPRPKARPQTTFVDEAMIAVRRDGRYLLRRSPPGERWAGLWEFLRIGFDDDGRPATPGRGRKGRFCQEKLSRSVRGRLERAVCQRFGIPIAADADALEFHHTVTRFRVRLLCVTAEERADVFRLSSNFRWAAPAEFRKLALSMPARTFADRLVIVAREPEEANCQPAARAR